MDTDKTYIEKESNKQMRIAVLTVIIPILLIVIAYIGFLTYGIVTLEKTKEAKLDNITDKEKEILIRYLYCDYIPIDIRFISAQYISGRDSIYYITFSISSMELEKFRKMNNLGQRVTIIENNGNLAILQYTVSGNVYGEIRNIIDSRNV